MELRRRRLETADISFRAAMRELDESMDQLDREMEELKHQMKDLNSGG